jgi:hypothetical protein
MGVMLIEEYVCNFCGKEVIPGNVLLGTLETRRQGSKGRPTHAPTLAFHPSCADTLVKGAERAVRSRKPKA